MRERTARHGRARLVRNSFCCDPKACTLAVRPGPSIAAYIRTWPSAWATIVGDLACFTSMTSSSVSTSMRNLMCPPCFNGRSVGAPPRHIGIERVAATRASCVAMPVLQRWVLPFEGTEHATEGVDDGEGRGVETSTSSTKHTQAMITICSVHSDHGLYCPGRQQSHTRLHRRLI